MTEDISPLFERPLSPHLSIYKWHITMACSILHRITGVALVAGTVVLLAWLWAAAYSPACFSQLHDFLNGIFGRLLMFGWSLAFYFHLCNGIHHLMMDIGADIEINKANRAAWATLLFTGILTLITWYFVLVAGGM